MRRSNRILATALGLSLALGAGYAVAENGQAPNVSAAPAATGATSAVPALKEALKDSVWQVRAAAAHALGHVGAPAVPALTDALKDSVWQVRAAAAQALSQERSDR